MLKKVIIIAVTLILLVSMVGCSNTNDEVAATNTQANQENTEVTQEETKEDADAKEKEVDNAKINEMLKKNVKVFFESYNKNNFEKCYEILDKQLLEQLNITKENYIEMLKKDKFKTNKEIVDILLSEPVDYSESIKTIDFVLKSKLNGEEATQEDRTIFINRNGEWKIAPYNIISVVKLVDASSVKVEQGVWTIIPNAYYESVDYGILNLRIVNYTNEDIVFGLQTNAKFIIETDVDTYYPPIDNSIIKAGQDYYVDFQLQGVKGNINKISLETTTKTLDGTKTETEVLWEK
jgi:hypothetical protein